MPPTARRLVIFVHGWSVTSTDTYGEFPARLEAEAARGAAPAIDVKHIWLGKYVSFDDAVRVGDLSRAFEAACAREIGKEIDAGRRFVCITHSTGGPVIRDWWHRYYAEQNRPCPMSHLIMLAPANFGSALAQLGASRLSRIKAWTAGVQPGTGVLDWLELGSAESWELNRRWIETPASPSGPPHPFSFVLTGQSIDRSLYDHLNSYTGEPGSDGVVRVAAANLNSTLVRIEQEFPPVKVSGAENATAALAAAAVHTSPRVALCIVAGCSHSGEDIGILRSVRNDGRRHAALDAVLACLKVETDDDYRACCDAFDATTQAVQEDEHVEKHTRMLARDTYAITDRHAMVIFRVRDDSGRAVEDFDLVLTAGADNPDGLPQGFFRDRQRHSRERGVLTYFLDYDLMVGCKALRHDKDVVRKETRGMSRLGLIVRPRPFEGFVHFAEGQLDASVKTLAQVIRPNQTTLVDVTLRRLVRRGAFELTTDRAAASFAKQPLGGLVP